jgi:predicted acyltransferase
LVLVVNGWILGALGVVPVVKAIWTPSWVLFSAGWCFLFLATFYAVVDLAGFKRIVFPLTVIGMNSIVAYCLFHLYPALAFNSFRRIIGSRPFYVFGPAYEPMLYGCAVFALYWAILYALYRRRIFVRI